MRFGDRFIFRFRSSLLAVAVRVTDVVERVEPAVAGRGRLDHVLIAALLLSMEAPSLVATGQAHVALLSPCWRVRDVGQHQVRGRRNGLLIEGKVLLPQNLEALQLGDDPLPIRVNDHPRT